MMKKYLAIFIAFVMIITSVNVTGIISYADGLTHKPLPPLTGNKRIDAANIAYSQVGYKEKDTNINAYGPQKEWCVYFARWCAMQAGLDSSKWLYTPSTNYLIKWFQGQGRWYDKVSYTWNCIERGTTGGGKIDSYNPKPGDFAAIENDEDFGNGPDHTGIVYDADDNYVYLVEGNVGDEVVFRKYNRSNLTWTKDNYYTRIVGFGEPDYGEPNNGGQKPTGAVDIIQGKEGMVWVRGWAFDYDNTSVPLDIHVYVGDEGYSIKANTERTDVNSTYGGNIGNYHGFDSTFKVNARGNQEVKVYAIDLHDKWIDNPLIGSGTVNIKNIPFSIAYDKSSVKEEVNDTDIISFNFTGDGIYTMGYEVEDTSIMKVHGFTAVDWEKGTASIKIEALKPGNTKLCVNLLDNNYNTLFSKEIPVYVSQPVTGISLNKTSTTLKVGETEQLSATIKPTNASNKKITWTSSNTNVVTVNNTGMITAKSNGSAQITATTNDGGYTASCKVDVKNITPFSITYDISDIKEEVNDTDIISFNFTGDGIYTMRYEVKDTSIMKVHGFTAVDWDKGTASIKIEALKPGNTKLCMNLLDNNYKTLFSKEISVYVSQPVTGISLNKSSTTLNVGESEQLSATIKPTNASNKKITWTSSNTNVVTVNNTGMIIAKTNGSAQITATTNDGGYTASCKVEVNNALSGISFDKTSITMYVGNTTGLNIKPVPINAKLPTDITWVSSNTNVATIDNELILSSKAPGKTIITAKTKAGNHTATCVVTVKQATVPVTGISFSEDLLAINVCETKKLETTISPFNATNKNVIFESSNMEILTVDNDGTITGKKAGTSIVTVTTEDGSYKDSCEITVLQPTTSISLNKTNTSLIVGDTETLVATIMPIDASDKTILWSSDNTKVATINSEGQISAKSVGNATITAKTYDNEYTATCNVTVTEKQLVEIWLHDGNGKVGNSGYMTYSVEMNGNELQDMNWTSSDSSIISIDEKTGLMQFLKPGTAIITLTVNDVSATATMKAIDIYIDETEVKLVPGEQKKLTVEVLPDMSDYTGINWSSNNINVAIVNNGEITALKEGNATISCSYGPYTSKCKVNVTADDEITNEDENQNVPDGLWITGLKPTVIYNGNSISQTVYVYHGKTLLRENSDYKISYKNNKNAGTAQIIVTGKGNYTGKTTEYFEIEAIDIVNNSNVSINVDTAIETGQKLKPNVTVFWNNKKLKENKDFIISYNANIINANKNGYNITIEGIENYKGSVKKKFNVVEKDTLLLNNAKIQGISKKYVYDNGNPVGPQFDNIIVKIGQETLIKDKDYIIESENNKYVGIGTLIFKPAYGSVYAGEKKINYQIIGSDLKNGSIVGLNKKYSYTGEAITPSFYVFSSKNGNGMKISSDSYSISYKNNVNPGTATVVVEGIEEKGFSGKITATYKIQKLNINDNNISITMPKTSLYAKGGSKPIPIITHSYNGKVYTLREGIDYLLKYSNNKSQSGSKMPTIKIIGQGRYTGTITKNYNISKQNINNLSIIVTDKAYKANKKGNYYIAAPKIYDKNGKLLSKNTDYTVNYFNMSTGRELGKNDVIHNGTEILVKVIGKGNYNGTLTASYYVRSSKNINKVKSDKITNQQYTGSEVKPDINLYTKNGRTKIYLTEGTDYEIVGYYNNIKRGKASVIIKGIGDYSGSKIITFKIVAANTRSIWEGIFS